MRTLDTVVAICRTYPKAHEALLELEVTGFDMKKVSVVWIDHDSENDLMGFYILGRGYDSEEHVIGFPDANRRLKFWGQRALLWGQSWGTLFGSGLFLVPGLGRVVVLGPLVRWIVEALENEARPEGLSALGAGLERIGIPTVDVFRYEAALKAERVVVVTHGDTEDLAASRRLLEHAGSVSVDQHTASSMLGSVG